MILQTNSQPSFTVKIPITITEKLHDDPSLPIDIKSFMPAVVSSTYKNNIRIHGSFSLANLEQDAGERLRNDNNTLPLLRQMVTLRWFDNAICPDETLSALVEQCQKSYADGMMKTVMGVAKPVCMTTFVHGNAVDLKITSFHGLIDLDRDLYPVLVDARAANEQVFSRAVFSLADMGMDSGDKLFYLRAYLRFVQDTWALPGSYIGISMHVVQEIASLAYWKKWSLEFRLDKRGDALAMSVHFPNLQEVDFVINIFQENDPEFNPYPLMKEWLRFFRSTVKDVAELRTIRIVIDESIAEKIECLNDGDVVITKEQMPPYPCK